MSKSRTFPNRFLFFGYPATIIMKMSNLSTNSQLSISPPRQHKGLSHHRKTTLQLLRLGVPLQRKRPSRTESKHRQEVLGNGIGVSPDKRERKRKKGELLFSSREDRLFWPGESSRLESGFSLDLHASSSAQAHQRTINPKELIKAQPKSKGGKVPSSFPRKVLGFDNHTRHPLTSASTSPSSSCVLSFLFTLIITRRENPRKAKREGGRKKKLETRS